MVDSRWPNDAPIAVVCNVMYEQWAPGVAPGLGPMGNPLPNGVTDYQALSWAAYGRRTGIFKLLGVLDEFGVAASLYASGILAESAPESLRLAVSKGHELCGHAYSQDVVPAMLGEDDERRDVTTSLAALEAATGVRPTGWISPRCTPSPSTARILAGAGLTWYGDVFDADLPYCVETAEGSIVALPFGMEVNDLPMFVRYGAPARELTDTFLDVVGELRRSAAPAYVDVTVHAHVSGRPAGLAALRSILAATANATDCTFATRGEVAATAS